MPALATGDRRHAVVPGLVGVGRDEIPRVGFEAGRPAARLRGRLASQGVPGLVKRGGVEFQEPGDPVERRFRGRQLLVDHREDRHAVDPR